MKKFCLYTLAFACLVCVSLPVLDIVITKTFQRSTGRKFVSWNHTFLDTTYHDLIISGSSRAWKQYDPYILDSILHLDSYNLGIDGSAINRQVIKYQAYCRHHPTPKYLIQNVDFFTLQETIGFEREQFYPYFFDTLFLKTLDKYEHFSFCEKYVPCFRYFGYPKISAHGNLYKGYEGQNMKWKGKALTQVKPYPAKVDTNMYRLFDNFLYDCVQDSTKVLLVYAPTYYGVLEKITNMQDIYDMYQTIANKYCISFLNYNEDSMCLDTTYFYNATHLNKRGAELFSTKLAHDIDSIGFLR